jgi:hypothetical protein
LSTVTSTHLTVNISLTLCNTLSLLRTLSALDAEPSALSAIHPSLTHRLTGETLTVLHPLLTNLSRILTHPNGLATHPKGFTLQPICVLTRAKTRLTNLKR